MLQELIDLRLLHQIRSRVTVSSKPGKIFKSFLLDVSQYTGERARRDVEMIEFWKDSEKEKLRRASSIYDPLSTNQQTRQSSTKEQNDYQSKSNNNLNDQQMTLDL